MATQLQPIEQSAQRRQTASSGAHANPRARVTKKKRVASKRREGLARWMKWTASSVGLIATIVATVAGFRQIHPLPPTPPDPRIKVDGQATLARSSKNNQLELRVGLTLLNEGGSVAVIPRPKISLGDTLISPNDIHFTFPGEMTEVIFPISLHEGANSFEKKIICSIAEGRNSDWYQTRLLQLNLDFRPEGHDPISHCLVVIPPLADGNQPLSSDESKCFTITDDCLAFGDGFKRTS